MQRRDFLRGAGLVALGGLVLPASGLAGPTAPPPPGFASNLNYYIYGGGQPIQGLKVTLEFTDALHAPTGINMQLNAYAGAGDHAVYQQYCMGLSPRDPTKLGWSNENFPAPDWRWTLHQRGVHDCGPQDVNPVKKADCKGDIFNVNTDKVGAFPAMDNEIPAGAKLTWELINGPDGKVVGAIYSCDAGGVSHSSQQQLIDTFPYDGVSQHVGLDSMSPIYAFQMNIVALNGGRHADFGGGAGRIIYEAQTPLSARGSVPPGLAASKTHTGESSNVTYATLPQAPSTRLVQGFGTPFCPSDEAYNPVLKACEYIRATPLRRGAPAG
jgi:hypothetical protein